MYNSPNLDKNQYTELMTSLKKLNQEYIEVRKDGTYKIGYAVKTIFKSITTFNFKELIQNIDFFIRQQKAKKLSNGSLNKEISSSEPCYFANEKIAVYTCIFGQYDKLQEPLIKPDNIDYFVITDQDIPEDSLWKKVDIEEFTDRLDSYNNVMKNRYFKMFPEKVFDEYKYSIYIDGNIRVITDLTEYLYKLSSVGISIHSHGLRNCVYNEASAAKIFKKSSPSTIKAYMERLTENNFPKQYGLLECNVILRSHHNEICKHIMQQWWAEFEKYIKRDQLSLPFILFKNNIAIEEVALLGDNIYKNPSFRIVPHKN